MPSPESRWKITPAPPKMPAPSFFCSPTEISTSGVLQMYAPDCTMKLSARSIWISRIEPGSCAAKATKPPCAGATYSVRNS